MSRETLSNPKLPPPAPAPVCSCPTTMMIDGEWYEYRGHCEPDCPIGGWEAHIKAQAPYYAADNPERVVGSMKGKVRR